ncbi:MAG: hypothetical protein HBSAPP03_22990 [Phycisphaerae bacterium]|nr:MAG: hypothetical protein HBSAPP03_22990 [Phycisphaerae bacterium]
MPLRFHRFAPVALAALAVPAFAAHTNNILITGYWPPTNEMIRPFSQNPTQNPGGWRGENWENRGYDIFSFFPEFPGITSPPYGRGQGDFEVDYQDASADFWRVVEELRPIAIITFSRGSAGSNWELESRARKLPLNAWTPDYLAPTRPTPDLPIANEPDNFIRYSSLPMTLIRDAVNASGLGIPAFIDTSNNFGGTFVSEFTSYHSAWYANLNADPSGPAWCIAGGHIHVGGDTPVAGATLATQVTLRTLTDYLDTVVPAPGTVVPIAVGLFAASRRRRT